MVRIEFCKLLHNKIVLGLLLVLSLGIQISKRLMPDFWLFISCIVIGQVMAEGFTDGNLRNEVMTVQNRIRLILIKTASSALIVLLLFMLNTSILIVRNAGIYTIPGQIELTIYQLLLVEAQVVIYMGLSIFIKSFSGIAIAAMILFVFYHVCEMAQNLSALAFISRFTYLKLYPFR